MLCVWPDVLPIKGWREVRMSHGNDKQKKLQEMPTIFIRLTEKTHKNGLVFGVTDTVK